MTLTEFTKLSFTARAKLAQDNPRDYRRLRGELKVRQAQLQGISLTAVKLTEREAARAEIRKLYPPGAFDGDSVA